MKKGAVFSFSGTGFGHGQKHYIQCSGVTAFLESCQIRSRLKPRLKCPWNPVVYFIHSKSRPIICRNLISQESEGQEDLMQEMCGDFAL